MVVKELRAGRLHDRRRDAGCRRFANDGGKFGNAFPVAVVIEETARFTGSDDVSGVWPRLTLIARYALGDRFDPIFERTTQANSAIALESSDIVL
ncbi:hypothetical protein M5585_04440 [Serratia ureilytica]